MMKKILIGSVLKPVDDVRHYHKIAKSLVKTGFEIHVFGFHSNDISVDKNIIFHSQKPFKRISFARVLASFKFLFLGLRLNPYIVICGTHELLKFSVLIKFIKGSKVIYDIRENYYKNIICTNVFPFPLRHFLGFLVRINESIQSLFVDHFILAEKCYLDELPFLKKHELTIIENKYEPIENQSELQNDKAGRLKFIMTGTIAEHYGISEAVSFYKNIKSLNINASLNVSGVCIDKELWNKLRLSDIQLSIDSTPIPYLDIITTIQNGEVALLPYQNNAVSKSKIPTKFFEYLYFKIPMIVQINPVWEAFLNPYMAAIFIDFNDYDREEVHKQLNDFEFYSGKSVGNEILWKGEEEQLLNIDLFTG